MFICKIILFLECIDLPYLDILTREYCCINLAKRLKTESTLKVKSKGTKLYLTLSRRTTKNKHNSS